MNTELETGFRIAAQLLAMTSPLPADVAAADRGWWVGPGEPPIDPRTRAITRTSCYVPAADGTRLAVDVYLPADLVPGTRLPAIFIQTRYLRFPRFADWAAPLADKLISRLQDARRYAADNYAFVVADARGSGASFGYRLGELHDSEARDGYALCDWICAQPWSNGRIAVTGISYEGSTGEHLLSQHHPAVRAAVIRYSLFDAYADIICPGGLRLGWFQQDWGRMIARLDANLPDENMPVLGVMPVDDDADGSQLARAIEEHRDNADLEAAMRPIAFRDDAMADGRTLAEMSPVYSLEALRESHAAIYSWSAYFDGGYPAAAVKRFLALGGNAPGSRHRLILGPWDHGNRSNADPTGDTPAVGFDVRSEILRFCDRHLVDTLPAPEPRVHYYTLNEGRWKQADIWPPPEFEPTAYYLGADHTLSTERPDTTEDADAYRIDYGCTSGASSRWRSYVNPQGQAIGYRDRTEEDRKCLTYDSAVLREDLEVTGHPVVTLYLAADREDTALHVYLEEVRPDGRVVYVTEGVFHAIHRKPAADAADWDSLVPAHSYRRADAMPLVPGDIAEIAFGLLPVSYLFKTGSRIRLACSGADKDNFDRVPPTGPAPRWSMQRSNRHPSSIVLPQRVRPDAS